MGIFGKTDSIQQISHSPPEQRKRITQTIYGKSASIPGQRKQPIRSRDLYADFLKMVDNKYHLSETNYENMTRGQRNFLLQKLIGKEHIVVFPENVEQLDGLP